MKAKASKLLLVALAAVMLLGCFGCQSETADNSLNYIKENGKLIMGLDDSFPPMGFRDEKNEIVGFDVDIAKEVTSRMGVELVLQPIDWKAKEMELKNKNVDVLWNGFTITEERKQELTFSEPYMYNEQIIVVKADSSIASKADLAGKVIALQDGSSAVDALDKDEALKNSLKDTVGFADNVKALMDLANGQVDAVLVDSVVGNYYVSLESNAGKFKVLDDVLAQEEYGIGMRKGDTALKNEIDKIIQEMIDDGTYKTISEKWFGKDVSIKK